VIHAGHGQGISTVVEGVSSAEVVRVLKEQHQLLIQLLLIVASEMEGDAACLMESEGRVVKLQKDLEASRSIAARMETEMLGGREAQERCHRMGLEVQAEKTRFEAFKKRADEESREMAHLGAALR
jgi:hypothetical protein